MNRLTLPHASLFFALSLLTAGCADYATEASWGNLNYVQAACDSGQCPTTDSLDKGESHHRSNHGKR